MQPSRSWEPNERANIIEVEDSDSFDKEGPGEGLWRAEHRV